MTRAAPPPPAQKKWAGFSPQFLPWTQATQGLQHPPRRWSAPFLAAPAQARLGCPAKASHRTNTGRPRQRPKQLQHPTGAQEGVGPRGANRPASAKRRQGPCCPGPGQEPRGRPQASDRTAPEARPQGRGSSVGVPASQGGAGPCKSPPPQPQPRAWGRPSRKASAPR
jgi:hypothetical protein